MKCFLILILAFNINFVSNAQTAVGYSHDAHGNRTQRKLVVSSSNRSAPGDSIADSLSYSEKTMLLAMEYGVSVFPNPTQTNLSFVANKLPEDSKTQAVLFDNTGKVIQTFNDFQPKEEIPMSYLKPGIYYLSVTINNKDKLAYKIVKQ